MAVETQEVVALIERYGYLIVAVSAFAEALPLLGFLIPGQAIIILAGAVAATGLLDLWLLILIAIPAGIFGDALGYYAGRYYGRAFMERYGARLRIGQAQLEKSDRLFQKYGPFALILARFSFLTRNVGPILAGISRMRFRVFWPINVAGAILWAGSYVVLGYFFGASFLALQGAVGRILAFTALGLVALVAFYRLLRRYAPAFTRGDFQVALMGLVGATGFGLVTDRVARVGVANVVDRRAEEVATLLAPLAPFLEGAQVATGVLAVGAASVLVVLVLLKRERRWEAGLVALGVGGILLLVRAADLIFAAFVPVDVLAATRGGWPSAHGAVPVVFAGVLLYVAVHTTTRWGPRLAWALLAAGFATVAAFSRLGLGRELPSAVLAGLFLGAAWLSVSILVVEFGLKRQRPLLGPGVP